MECTPARHGINGKAENKGKVPLQDMGEVTVKWPGKWINEESNSSKT